MYQKISKQPSRLGSFERYGRSGLGQEAPLPEMTAPNFQQPGGAGGVMVGISSILGVLGTTGAQIYAAQQAAKLEKARMRAQGSSAPAFDPAAMMAMMQSQQQQSAISPGVIIALVLVGLIMLGGMMYVATKSSSAKKKRRRKHK